MTNKQALRERSAFLFAIAVVLFLPPLLLVANHGALILGVPVFLAYVFACWAAVIIANAMLAFRLSRTADAGKEDGTTADGATPTAPRRPPPRT